MVTALADALSGAVPVGDEEVVDLLEGEHGLRFVDQLVEAAEDAGKWHDHRHKSASRYVFLNLLRS